jgi:hypothetical protein
MSPIAIAYPRDGSRPREVFSVLLLELIMADGSWTVVIL